MLVYVVRLRRGGVKLSREAVLLATPVRGALQLAPAKPGWHRNRPMATLRVPGQSEWALPPLDDARVTRIDDRGMLIARAGEGILEPARGRAPGVVGRVLGARVAA